MSQTTPPPDILALMQGMDQLGWRHLLVPAACAILDGVQSGAPIVADVRRRGRARQRVIVFDDVAGVVAGRCLPRSRELSAEVVLPSPYPAPYGTPHDLEPGSQHFIPEPAPTSLATVRARRAISAPGYLRSTSSWHTSPNLLERARTVAAATGLPLACSRSHSASASPRQPSPTVDTPSGSVELRGPVKHIPSASASTRSPSPTVVTPLPPAVTRTTKIELPDVPRHEKRRRGDGDLVLRFSAQAVAAALLNARPSVSSGIPPIAPGPRRSPRNHKEAGETAVPASRPARRGRGKSDVDSARARGGAEIKEKQRNAIAPQKNPGRVAREQQIEKPSDVYEDDEYEQGTGGGQAAKRKRAGQEGSGDEDEDDLDNSSDYIWTEVDPRLGEPGALVDLVRHFSLAIDPRCRKPLDTLLAALAAPQFFQGLHLGQQSGGSSASLDAQARLLISLNRGNKVITVFMMLSSLQFFVHTQQLRQAPAKLRDIWEKEIVHKGVSMSWRQFEDERSLGSKLLELVKAGGFGMLVIIALLNLKSRVRATPGPIIAQFATYIRTTPTDDKITSRMVTRDIVPALLYVDRSICVRWASGFVSGEGQSLCSHDLQGMHEVYKRVKQNVMRLEPWGKLWQHHMQSCSHPPGVGSSVFRALLLHAEEQEPIQEKDLPEKLNLLLPFDCLNRPDPIIALDAKKGRHWTEKNRRKAASRQQPKDMDTFQKMLQSLPETYTQVPDMEDARPIQFTQKADQEFCALWIPTLRGKPELIARARDRLETQFADFKYGNSEEPGYAYPSKHYVFYNRFSQKGDGAPTNIHPNRLQRGNTEEFKYRIPRAGKDILENVQEFEEVCESLEEYINHVLLLVRHYMPDEYDIQVEFCETLPLHEAPFGRPMTGLFVNLSVATNAHRDYGDFRICVLCALGEWDGGEVVLHEMGLVFKLHPGDILIFRSGRLTHFNLHYRGMRASLVLSSDKEGEKWVWDYNGWKAHIN